MNIDQHPAVAVLRPSGVVLTVITGTSTLDEGRAPYGQVTLTAKAPDDRDALDLRADEWLGLELRLSQHFGATLPISMLTAVVGGSIAALTTFAAGGSLAALTNRLTVPWNAIALPSTRRTQQLLVVSRRFDDKRGTVEIVAATHEARLLGDVLVADAPLTAPSSSLRAVCSWILQRYGAVLEVDTIDATVAELDALTWPVGRAAWDWLNPLLEAASLRLWCDDSGVWRLNARQSTTPGAVVLASDATITELTDSMRLDDPEVWADAVVIEYVWTDDANVRHEAVDAAGAQPAKSAYVIKREAVYPGPGAAAGMLNRLRGRGRVMEVTARSDYRTAPGQPVSITAPPADTQVGYVTEVSWRLPSAEMRMRTRALLDMPPTAWDFLAVGQKWTDSPLGASWISETV